MDFKAVDEGSFNSIIEDWYDILGNLLHKGIQKDDIEIKFPQQYVDWLLHSDNPYYEQVGKELQKTNGKITLSTEAIDDDIIALINYKVSHKLQEKKDDFSFVVFSNPIIRNSSFVVKRVRLEGIEFMRYDSWMDIIKERLPLSFTVNGISFEMVKVEEGTFRMGATPEQARDAQGDEKPAHNVLMSSFYIGKNEVIQELWLAVMGANPSDDDFKGTKVPVVNISWEDCKDFIKKLNKLTGKKFRLPTEAEWEFAARGGILSKGYKYAGSDNIDEVAWYDGNSGNHPHPVGQKQPNELGLYDMSGNVYEWCQDWYSSSYYKSSTYKNPTGPENGDNRVCRGGSCQRKASSCRSSFRSLSKPSTGGKNLGLRLAF